MIRLRILARLMIAGWAASLAGCTDRAPLVEPATVGSGPYLLGYRRPTANRRLRPAEPHEYLRGRPGRRQVSFPLIGDVAASDSTVDELANRIRGQLATHYLREPNVTVEVATYRPFFVLGEVGNPGQYPYVPGITAETAVAVAGGFTDRANKRVVRVSRTVKGKLYESRIRVIEPIRPGDTIYVPESLF